MAVRRVLLLAGIAGQQLAFVVARQRKPARGHQEMRRFKWQQRSGKIVAEVYDGIGAAPPNVGGDRFEGREIAVNVRNERQSHVSLVLGRVYPRRGKRRGL